MNVYVLWEYISHCIKTDKNVLKKKHEGNDNDPDECIGLNLLGVILILAFMVDPPRGDAEHHQVNGIRIRQQTFT